MDGLVTRHSRVKLQTIVIVQTSTRIVGVRAVIFHSSLAFSFCRCTAVVFFFHLFLSRSIVYLYVSRRTCLSICLPFSHSVSFDLPVSPSISDSIIVNLVSSVELYNQLSALARAALVSCRHKTRRNPYPTPPRPHPSFLNVTPHQ